MCYICYITSPWRFECSETPPHHPSPLMKEAPPFEPIFVFKASVRWHSIGLQESFFKILKIENETDLKEN